MNDQRKAIVTQSKKTANLIHRLILTFIIVGCAAVNVGLFPATPEPEVAATPAPETQVMETAATGVRYSILPVSAPQALPTRFEEFWQLR